MTDAALRARNLASAHLRQDPSSSFALLCSMLLDGAERDYLALVAKQYRSSWTYAQSAQRGALALVERGHYRQDALFTLGFNQYIRQQMPFFLRPMMRLDGPAQKDPVRNFEVAAREGRFLNGVAAILLIGIYQAENKRSQAFEVATTLHHAYPGNATFWHSAQRLRKYVESSGSH